ncbi:MAG: hypothetical protein RLZZ543_503 [Bacteroidota bacterium]|jgi:uncharacterized delta-60 repeat protein
MGIFQEYVSLFFNQLLLLTIQHMKNPFLLFCFALPFLSNSLNAQTPWALDSNWGQDGIVTHNYGYNDNITDVKVQPDNKVVVVGTALSAAFAGRLMVARYLPDGALDPSFNDSGSVIINDFTESYAYECLIRTDGKIVVVGAAANPQYQFSMLALRLNADGSLDSTFGVNGFTQTDLLPGDEFAYSIAEQADHKYILAGNVSDTAFRNVPAIIRLKEDGSIDDSFGIGGLSQIPATNSDNDFSSVLVQADGKIVASGHYDQGLTDNGQNNFDFLIARFDENGLLDPSFSNDGVDMTPVSNTLSEEAYGMKITADGNILLSGYTTLNDFTFEACLVQYKNSGILDPNFGVNGKIKTGLNPYDVFNDVTITNQHILAAGGTGEFFSDNQEFLLYRFNLDGSIDSSFGTNGYITTGIFQSFDEANALALQSDGKILLAGKGRNTNDNDAAIVRYTNEDQSGISTLKGATSISVFPNPVAAGQSINITLSTAKSEIIDFSIFSADGRLCAKWNAGQLNAGTTNYSVEIPSTLSNGAYILSAKSSNGSISSQLLLISK